MSARAVLTQFNLQLLQQLPLENAMFFAMAAQEGLFPLDIGDSIAIMSTRAQKVNYFLQHVVDPGAEEYLPKLLKVMKESEFVVIGRLADDMQAAMGIDVIQKQKEDEESSRPQIDPEGNFKELYSQAIYKLGSEELHLCKVVFFGPPGVGKSSLCRVLIKLPDSERDSTGVFDLKLVQFKVEVTKDDTEQKSIWNIVTLEKEIERLRLVIERKLHEQKHPTEKEPPHQKKVSLEDASLPNVDDVVEKEINIHERICQKVPDSLTKNKKYKTSNIIIALYDSGGQPEFFDVIPLLHTLPTGNVMVFNMNELLEAKIKPELYEKGHLVSTGKQTHYTNAELMKTALASIESCVTKQASPLSNNVLVVGTHLDEYTNGKENVEESLSQMDSQLIETVLSDSTRKMIVYYEREGKQGRIVHPISNTKCSEEQNEVAQKIRTAIEVLSKSANTKTEIPSSWLLFQYQLRLLGKPCVTLNKCQKIAKDICYVEEDVEVVLKYFHDLGILLYYEELDSVAFCDPQWLFEQLSKLIKSKYNASYKEDVKNGIVIKTFMEKIFSSLEGDSGGILKLNDLLNLFASLNIMVKLPVKCKEWSEEERYFMPALLDPAPPNLSLDLGEKCYDTLYVMYKGTLFPRGMFCCIVTLTQYRRKFMIMESKDYMYKNLIVFQDENGNYLLLSDKLNYMTIDVYQSEVQNQYNLLQDIHCELLQTLRNVCEKMKLNYQFEFGFACQVEKCKNTCSKESTTSIAIIELLGLNLCPQKMYCKTCKKYMPLNYNQLLWFIPLEVLKVLKAELSRQSDAQSLVPMTPYMGSKRFAKETIGKVNQESDKQITPRHHKKGIEEAVNIETRKKEGTRESKAEICHKVAHLTIYEKYFEKLVRGLPMDDVTFKAQLTTNKLLPSSVSNHFKSLPSECDKADHFLKRVITSSFDIDDTEEFTSLISTMEICGFPHIERLAKKMKSDLEIELKEHWTDLSAAD